MWYASVTNATQYNSNTTVLDSQINGTINYTPPVLKVRWEMSSGEFCLTSKCTMSLISTNFQPKRSSGHQDSQRTSAGDLPPHQRNQGARHPFQGGVQPSGGERADQAGPGRESRHRGGDWGPGPVHPQDQAFWAKVATPTYIWERAHEDWNSPIEANYKPISPG